MKISEQWLREWVSPDVDTAALSEQLTMAGLEVDGIEAAAPSLNNVVVGRVLEKDKHPNADKLSVCKVDVGDAEPLPIVCGAANVAAGGVYPVAVVGAVLPGDFKIKKSKLRGEPSHGMLCSGVELGIAEEADGLLELADDLVPGTPVSQALQLDDAIIDLDLTPNRADCFSVVGTARDVAAVNGLPFAEPEEVAVPSVNDDSIAITLAAGDACPAFAGRVIRNVDVSRETPLWMAERLRRAGVRPLSPVVDVTNYVMLELGQPMHAYDLGKLQGGVSARLASDKETLTLLDGQADELADDVLVIADAKKAVALAGIMGGEATAVSDSTTDIFLESAFFSPAVMAGKARRFGLHTDASLRFERGVDFVQQTRAVERATELLLEIVGGEPGPVSEARNDADLPVRAPVQLRSQRLMRCLGIELPAATVTEMLERLGCDVVAEDGLWTVTPPAYRFDLAIEEDLIEEVVRLYGYDQVPEIPESAELNLALSGESQVTLERACDTLVARGYQEVITYSFVDPQKQTALLGDTADLELANPLSTEQSVMRRSLLPGLLQVASDNRKRQQSRLRLFESGAVFSQANAEITESDSLAGLIWGGAFPEHWDGRSSGADMFDIKSDVESLLALTGQTAGIEYSTAEHPALRPGRTARIERAGEALGWLGELHPRLAKQWGLAPAPLLFELNTEHALASVLPVYEPVSKYPSVRRDLAVLVDAGVDAGRLITVASEAAGDMLRDIRVFDVYTGDGIENSLKSVALGLILQETSRTLTELEIDGVMNAVAERLSSEFNATIRE